MSIVERFKREIDQTIRQSMTNFQAEEEENQPTQINSHSVNPLIQQIHSTDLTEQSQEYKGDYQAQQFQYFANQIKNKPTKCVVCKKLNPKYKCPKCKIKYCSQEHYKTHNLYCTERFFKQQVQNKLKTIKSGKEDKKKMIQILKQNQQFMAKDQRQLINEVKIQQITEKRLNEILVLLENNQTVNLTDSQTKHFQSYIKQIQVTSIQKAGVNLNQHKQNQQIDQIPPFEQYKPFWLIQQGLSQYFLIDQCISAQDYNKSNHKQIIDYRQLSSQLLRQDLQKLGQNINFKKTSLFVNYDLVQVIYISALLFRSFNGQYLNNLQFIQAYLTIYDDNLAKSISSMHSGHIAEMIKLQINIVGLIKCNLLKLQAKDKQSLSLLHTWLPVILNDCQIIFNNKYLCLQTLFRILQGLKSVSQNNQLIWSDEVMMSNKKELKKQKSKEAKQRNNKILKMVKKIQFLLCFSSQVVYKEQNHSFSAERPQIFNHDNKQLIISLIHVQKEKQSQLQQDINNFNYDVQKEKQRKINDIIIPKSKTRMNDNA